ncbi:MAG: acyl-CoA synthetase [Anaerolineaceae bacterium 4572_32.1]|nr:MAG: acyl-CoA synthetase [Anaerolineaceae bacterium 4572_32.1]
MLDMFSNPHAVAVIGASRNPDKLGYGILSNIIQYGFSGQVYPINPKSDEILGLTCYPSVLDVPGPIELAVIVVPYKFVAATLQECGQKGVKGAIVISAGFREAGLEGVRREKELSAIAKEYNIRLIGPNCLGLIDTHCPLNASFAAGMPPTGQIAFMSQSGALCTAILDWALAQGIGFSRFVSLGNKADIDEIDLLAAWEKDPHTKVILMYTEGLTDGQRFMKVARRVTKSTPVVAVKSGTTNAGSRAVSSHTGSLAGSEQAYKAAFSQAGVVRAESIEEMFDFSTAFSYQPAMRGNRVAIVTNAGGPGIMATDAVEREGLQLASLSAETIETLQAGLPSASNIYNPIDVLGDALADRYSLALEAVLKDDGVNGVMVILTPQVMTQILETAEVIASIAARYDKPVLGCFMGQAKVSIGIRVLNRHRVPNYSFPERAANVLRAMAEYYRWREKPPMQAPTFDVDKTRVRALFEQVKSEGRLSIGDAEARQVLEAYGIPVPRSRLAATAEEAVRQADEIGFPVALKIASPDILHKTDIGGIKLDLRTPVDVRDAFDLLTYRATRYMPEANLWGCQVQEMVGGGREVILGMNRDPQFGPLMMFGMGGIYVEALKDVVFRIAPFSRQEARTMLTEIQTIALLRGLRGEPPSDLDAIEDVLLRLSQLVIDFPDIVEMDINPLIVFEKGRGAMGVDMRLVLS